MWKIDSDGCLASDWVRVTDNAVFVTKEYFAIRPVNYAIEKKTFGDPTVATRLAVFDTEEDAIEYLKKLVAKLNAEEI